MITYKWNRKHRSFLQICKDGKRIGTVVLHNKNCPGCYYDILPKYYSAYYRGKFLGDYDSMNEAKAKVIKEVSTL